LDSSNPLPIWLPKTHVWFNYSDYELEQAVGAIKARVQENGGQVQPLTPIKRAEIFNAEELFRRDKSRMNSEHGLEKILESVAELFRHIEKHCEDINEQKLLELRCGSEFIQRSMTQTCTITNGRVSMQVVWYQPYSNILDDSSLIIGEYKGGLILPSEKHQRYYLKRPTPLRESKYSPELSIAREYGWTERNRTEFLASGALAEKCVIRFIDLANKEADEKCGR
jgi:hypothetical protein